MKELTRADLDGAEIRITHQTEGSLAGGWFLECYIRNRSQSIKSVAEDPVAALARLVQELKQLPPL